MFTTPIYLKLLANLINYQTYSLTFFQNGNTEQIEHTCKRMDQGS